MSQLAHTRPRSATEIIDAAFGFYRARFGDLLVVSVLLIVPPVLLAPLAPDWLSFLIMLAGNLMYLAGQGAIAILVAAAIERNESITAGEVFRRLGRRAGTVILVSIASALMMMIGFFGFATGTWWMTHLTADWDFYELLIPQILRGCSMMLCMVPINNIALGTLPLDRLKNASGLFNLTRNLGGAVGLAVINTVLIDRSAFHYARLAEHVEWGSAAAQQKLQNMTLNFEQTAGLDATSAAISKLSAMVHQQAALLSFMDVFFMLTVLFATLGLFTMVIRKPVAAGGGGGGH